MRLPGRFDWIAIWMLCVAVPAAAQVRIGAGAEVDLGAGALDLAGAGLRVEGALAAGSATLDRAGSVEIAAGAVLFGEAGAIRLFGDWRNDGLFTAGSSRVTFLDQAGAVSQLLGATNFHVLELLGGGGKTYRLQSGLTQGVNSLLRIQGSPSSAVQLAGSNVGQAAFLNLASAGQQAIAHVGVSDVHATGQWLAPGQQNQGGSGNALRWFGGGPPAPTPVPIDSTLALLLLAGLLLLFARRRLLPPEVLPASSLPWRG